MPKPSDLLQGTLDLLILKAISREPAHGWGIAKRIQVLSDEVLSVQLTAEWKDTELGREAKFYALTREGRRQLERELQSWSRLSSAVQLVLERT